MRFFLYKGNSFKSKMENKLCLNKGKPFSKAKYNIWAIEHSTVREIFEIVVL